MKNKELEKDLEKLLKAFSQANTTAWTAGMFYPNKQRQDKAEEEKDKFIKLLCEIEMKY